MTKLEWVKEVDERYQDLIDTFQIKWIEPERAENHIADLRLALRELDHALFKGFAVWHEIYQKQRFYAKPKAEVLTIEDLFN